MKRLLSGLLIAGAIALCVAALLQPRVRQDLLEPPEHWPGGDFVLIEIADGASATGIAEDLAQKGLIRSAHAFVMMLRQQDLERKLKPGLYKIEPGSSARQIAQRVIDHDTWRVRVTIPEGLTVRQIGERIEEAGAVEGGRWLPTAAEVQMLASAGRLERVTGISIPTRTAEGYLFPDTYHLPAGASVDVVVDRLFDEFVSRFSGAHAPEIARNALSLHELVTLASIVEREAATDKERPLIAQVFINRIEIGMKLESCATVQFALPEHKPRLTFADLEIDSPYNTYKHKGLPPGPICSPGEASLLAALRPQATDALYFVSKGDGTHRFSRTFAEHERAIQEIRR